MASEKELLLNTLKNLRDDDLKEFQWRLKNNHECIAECEMEKAARIETVNKMVACFGPEEAVKITVDLLRKMDQNDLAGKLENQHKHVGEAPVQKRSGAQPAASVFNISADNGARLNAPLWIGNSFNGPVNYK